MLNFNFTFCDGIKPGDYLWFENGILLVESVMLHPMDKTKVCVKPVNTFTTFIFEANLPIRVHKFSTAKV